MNIPVSVRKAWEYSKDHENDFENDLKQLVSQPSISAQSTGLNECAELIRNKMTSLGIKARLERVPDAPDVIYGELKGSKNAKTLVIYNHYDVQPVEPLEEWRSEPFRPIVKEGCMYGRGVGDDKGEIVARLSAIRSLLETEGSINSNIKWIIEGEEEVGSPHFHNFITKNKSLLKGDACLWEEGDRSASGISEIELGVKGLLYVEYRVRVGVKDQHSMYGPIAPNPAWRLTNLMKTIKDEQNRILIDGFYQDVRKPTPEERKYLKKNQFSTRDLKRALQIDYLYEGKNDVETVTNLLYSPSANIAGFGSGYLGSGSKTIIPREAFVKMDFRLVADMRANDILTKLRKHLKKHGFTDVELIVHSKEDPAKTPVDSYIAQTMIKCVQMVEGARPNVWPTSAGTGPLSLFTNYLKLPTAMGTGVNYVGAGFHAPNEHVVLDYYHKGIKQLICLFSLF